MCCTKFSVLHCCPSLSLWHLHRLQVSFFSTLLCSFHGDLVSCSILFWLLCAYFDALVCAAALLLRCSSPPTAASTRFSAVVRLLLLYSLAVAITYSCLILLPVLRCSALQVVLLLASAHVDVLRCYCLRFSPAACYMLLTLQHPHT